MVDAVADTQAVLERLAERRDKVRELRLGAAEKRHESTTADGLITVVVDGAGHIIDITIKDAEVRTPHPTKIGGRVLAVIQEARRAAADESRAALAEIMPGFLEDEDR
ncbi:MULTISPECIES: YbaB/EbfC family nucleoid-associated protein [Actinoalloteichus]|uniref:YbaB/EbfC family nucleoid-associated protein n=1 Tax=Actinoalloteichus fjordicus TaxID=1612552 RepID=A0AAC9LFR6_9PSEU|nr:MULTISPECIES: YbaB/EbfC family nucleoid-associated protein [Actinoalloteichus]APU16797.1 hypothetical protein UA74_23895 [Actinoalloteichus fjordicus]APU22862.1 hypothetical protein UA75_24400 [Actinoalloteichus sp. GBA129-24]